MQKKKTKKAAAKRFRVTRNGKVLYKKAGAGHLLTSKSRKRKRALSKTGVLSPSQTMIIKDLLST